MPELKIASSKNKISFCKATLLIFLLACSGWVTTALAFEPSPLDTPTAEATEEVVFRDNLGRDTPRSSFSGFLSATENFDYELAVQFMDLRNLPFSTRKHDGEELARQFDFVIKRGMRIDVDHLSTDVNGQVVDGLPEYRDELGRLVDDEEEQVLYLQRVPGADNNYIWKISNASVAHIPELYDYFSYPDWIENIRSHLPADSGFLGIELFKWVIILSAIVILLPLFWLLGFALSWLISRPGSPLHPPIRRLLTRPVAIFGVMLIIGKLVRELGLNATAQSIAETRTILTIVFVWIVFSLIDLFRARRREQFLAQGRADAHILGRPMANALKLFTLLFGGLVWMANAGIDITTLVAGLGIGGLALALALQKPIEDLLGAVSLYSQQPMTTGDLCKYGNVLGRIEEIGLRTTRIRTLNDTLVSVPNCIIAHGSIENYSARQKMLYHPDLPLRFDTTAEQMQTIIDDIDSMARSHEKVIKDSVRIRFTHYTENAMVIKARIYVDESDFSGYLAVVNDLNLSIMKIVEGAGAKFSQGARTIMLETGTELQPA